MIKKYVALLIGIMLLNIFAYAQNDLAVESASERILFYDDFQEINTENWTLSSSGNATCGAAEHDGRNTLAITKHDKTVTSHPTVKLNADIGGEYAVTTNVKIEQNRDAGTIKSFEYVYFTVSGGESVYRLQWFYNSNQFVLQKNGKQVAEKDYTKLAGYQKYNWNEYRFEVSDERIKVFINGKEMISYNDSSLADNTGTFTISGVTTYPKNVNIFIDDVTVSELPPDVIKVDPEYKCRITDEGKVQIECKIYGPTDRDINEAVLIGALYKDGVLKGAATQKVSIPSGEKSGSVFLEFEADDLFHELDLKLMLWDSENRLIPVGTGIADSTGYFIEDFDIIEGGTLLYDTDFSEGRPTFTALGSSYEAGGYRFEKLQGNDVLNVFGGYGKKGENRKYGIVLPDTLDAYAMEVTVRAHRFLSETASVILNYQSDDSYYALTWTQGGFPDIYTQYSVQRFRLCKDGETDLIAPRFEEVMDDDAPFISQTYRIHVFSNRILVYRKDDGTPLFSYQAEEPIGAGQIGFMVSGEGSGNMRYYVDDLKVWKF